ncbi:type IX secretion system sortase PorU [bacterium]|nr:type IX secretion system sortase PorU [bacterium]
MLCKKRENRKKRASKIFTGAVILFSGIIISAIGGESIRVSNTSGMGCTVSFNIQSLSVKDVDTGNIKFKQIDFKGGLWFGNAGEPKIPCASFLIGIPESGNVSVKVTTGEYEDHDNISIIPIPFEHEKNGFSVTEFRKGAAYNKNQSFPGYIYKTGTPGFIRENRVVKITIFPVQYNPVQKSVRIFHSIRVDVNWQKEVGISGKKNRNKNPMSKLLVNYAQAGNFIVKRKIPSIKKISFPAKGKRYKIPVSSTGMYVISGTFLKDNNIDINSINVSTIKIFNNGGRELPRPLSAERPDSLQQVPVLVTGIDDGTFDENDKIIFFARGTSGTVYDKQKKIYTHYLNRYTTENIYWLCFNDGKEGLRLKTKQVSGASSTVLPYFPDHYFYEQDRIPLFRGGMSWYNTELSSVYPAQHYTFFAHNPAESLPFVIRIRLKGGTTDNHYFSIKLNWNDISSFGLGNTQVVVKSIERSGGLKSGENDISIEYSASGEGAKSFVDWYEVDYMRETKAENGSLVFYSPEETGNFSYNLTGFTDKPIVMDVTDQGDESIVDVVNSSEGWTFSDVVSDLPRMYAAYDFSSFLEPGAIISADPPGLRNTDNSADMIIITAGDFLQEAEEIAAVHRDTDTLAVFVTTIDKVYDEFGWGLKDPVAIRDFVKYAYLNWQKQPVYLLLFGGGHFDYRNLLSGSQPNKIPPFEYEGSSLQQSRAADDFYCYISGDDVYPDIAVGRIPAWNTDDAEVVTGKIISYIRTPQSGLWKGLVTFLGDDEKAATGKENETTHIIASENIAETTVPARYNKKKIYLTEYPESYTTQRRLRPKAREALLNQINQGTVLFNFIGHGNKSVWTHEWVFHRDIDIPLLENGEKLPLFYGATCAFAQYDDPEDRSFAEALLTAQNKGGIASIGASRFCSSVPNEALDKSFISFLLRDTLSFGLSLQFAKSVVSYSSNNELYHLLGDPAMKLAVPRYNAELISMEPDSFKALSVVHVKGRVEKDNTLWDSFNGKVNICAFDSKKDVTYTTMYNTQIKYKLAGNPLFRGEGKIKDGIFNVDFVVPKDISYGGNEGRIYFYFSDNDVDGSGYMDNVAVGGSTFLNDKRGPDVHILFKGYENFMSGDMINENPQLIAEINDDKSGVNITGEIGHKIILTIDNAEQKDLTELFSYEEGSYLSGKIIYTLNGLNEGIHLLKIKAWDNANNSSEISADCKVVPENNLFFEDVLPYPNPFFSTTSITFKLNIEADITIKIFTVDGRMIRKIDSIWAAPGFNMVEWDGLDSAGNQIANGVYLYKLEARAQAQSGELSKSYIGKVMKMR